MEEEGGGGRGRKINVLLFGKILSTCAESCGMESVP